MPKPLSCTVRVGRFLPAEAAAHAHVRRPVGVAKLEGVAEQVVQNGAQVGPAIGQRGRGRKVQLDGGFGLLHLRPQAQQHFLGHAAQVHGSEGADRPRWSCTVAASSCRVVELAQGSSTMV